jgi:hypothetical protein
MKQQKEKAEGTWNHCENKRKEVEDESSPRKQSLCNSFILQFIGEEGHL